MSSVKQLAGSIVAKLLTNMHFLWLDTYRDGKWYISPYARYDWVLPVMQLLRRWERFG